VERWLAASQVKLVDVKRVTQECQGVREVLVRGDGRRDETGPVAGQVDRDAARGASARIVQGPPPNVVNGNGSSLVVTERTCHTAAVDDLDPQCSVDVDLGREQASSDSLSAISGQGFPPSRNVIAGWA
jgi:hypothetical protein